MALSWLQGTSWWPASRPLDEHTETWLSETELHPLTDDLWSLVDDYASEDRLYCCEQERTVWTYDRLMALDTLMGTNFPLDAVKIRSRARWIVTEAALQRHRIRPCRALAALPELKHKSNLVTQDIGLYGVLNDLWFREDECLHVLNRGTFAWSRVPLPPSLTGFNPGWMQLVAVLGSVYSVDCNRICRWKGTVEGQAEEGQAAAWHVMWDVDHDDGECGQQASLAQVDGGRQEWIGSAAPDLEHGRELYVMYKRAIHSWNPKHRGLTHITSLPDAAVEGHRLWQMHTQLHVANGTVFWLGKSWAHPPAVGPVVRLAIYMWRRDTGWRLVDNPTRKGSGASCCLTLSRSMIYNGQLLLVIPNETSYALDPVRCEWSGFQPLSSASSALASASLVYSASATLALRPIETARALSRCAATSAVVSPLEAERDTRVMGVTAVSIATALAMAAWTGHQLHRHGSEHLWSRLQSLLSPKTVMANWTSIVSVLQLCGLAVLFYASMF